MIRNDLAKIGVDWLIGESENVVDHIDHMLPSEYNQQVRYLPESVTPMPGPLRYDINPYMVEIVDCCDPRSPVREVSLMKGVQITYTTMIESVLLYYMGYVKTKPTMLVSADKELVKQRIENYILPMLQQSEMADIIQSSDEGNSRKTGKTANHLQWEGGGFMIPAGANNADKMRSHSIMLMLKDETDAWPDKVGKDGDPDKLTDDRCSAFWQIRKIFRGSTPLIKITSKIYKQYLRGDQRQYNVMCRGCGQAIVLRWEVKGNDNNIIGGFMFDIQDGTLIDESVRYVCHLCGHEHFERDKPKLFALNEGAHWAPTANPVSQGVRSYHLPAFYSPYGFTPWSKCVADYLDGFDPVERKVRDIEKYQVFYNNILGMPFDETGTKVRFESVSLHRRMSYNRGDIPNVYAIEHAGGAILFLTCQIDVHKSNLAVSVFGWTKGMRSFLVDYWRFEDDDCTQTNSPVWQRVRDLVSETVYVADDGKKYRLAMTLIDCGYANDTVVTFCAEYSGGVIPIIGAERPAKNQSVTEFREFKTSGGTIGYRIIVDHYKDRMSNVLRREWVEGSKVQDIYHFNAPVDMRDSELKELTVEDRRKVTDPRGNVAYKWYRPGNAKNELWDLLGYGYAAVEIMAYQVCIQYYELDKVDMPQFWQWVEENPLFTEG